MNLTPRHQRVCLPWQGGEQRRDINKQVSRIKQKAGLPKNFRALHGLRHVYASMLASSGQVDMYTLQKLLTHKSPQMTQRYAHLRDYALRKAAPVADDVLSAINSNAQKQSQASEYEEVSMRRQPLFMSRYELDLHDVCRLVPKGFHKSSILSEDTILSTRPLQNEYLSQRGLLMYLKRMWFIGSLSMKMTSCIIGFMYGSGMCLRRHLIGFGKESKTASLSLAALAKRSFLI